ncbi:hypothetical protein BDW75DRAFT_134414 [Aspergillus navahoensis]
MPVATNLTSWVPIVTLTAAPLANRTRLDCEEYKDNYDSAIPCDWIAQGVNFLDFISWNPSLDPYDCSLTNNARYCTVLGSGYYTGNLTDDPSLIYADYSSNAAPNSTEKCKQWYETMDSMFSLQLELTLTHFYAKSPMYR